MPRRKRAVENGSGDASTSSAKKVKTEKIEVPATRWEWENDGNVWTAYAEDMNEILSEKFANEIKDVTLTVAAKTKLQIIFDRMVQKNKATGWERRIQCALQDDSDSDYYVWQWEDEKGRWNPYSAKDSLELERSKATDEWEVSVKSCGRAYTIDVHTMKQTNDDTDVERNVRRIKTDTVQPKASGAVVKVESETKEGDEPTTSKSGAKGKSKGSTGSKSSGSKSKGAKVKEEPKSSIKTLVVKGRAPVDPECTAKVNSAHVYSEGNDVYDAMLNQTNIGNNNNKYYLCQILEDDNKKAYNVWFRWGRVGKNGQNSLINCGSNLDDAKQTFCGKFYDKTKNQWASRKNFAKVAGKYDLVQLDYNADDAEEEEEDEVDAGPPKKVPDSKLDKELQSLIQLICDVKKMEEAVIEMKYDAKKAPLGKLTAEQVKAGYSALKTIDSCIRKKDFGTRLTLACNDFYTRIPHDFGMRTPPVIRDEVTVKAKMELLEALEDIEVAMKIIKKKSTTENPVDMHYHALKCELTHIDRSSSTFKLINDYLQNTHAPTHMQYKMELQDLFDMDKEGESKGFVDRGNKLLLWHGSRLTNWMGILSKGLRIAPPEAPVTGYMFGKGIYFADMSSKSANYCFATKAKSMGLLVLCEVSLGKSNELLAADYKADQLPKGCHSVWGKGKMAPDPASNETLDGAVVPVGKGVDTGVTNPAGYTLAYNEFIVYDTKQIKMKYLLKIKFKFR